MVKRTTISQRIIDISGITGSSIPYFCFILPGELQTGIDNEKLANIFRKALNLAKLKLKKDVIRKKI